VYPASFEYFAPETLEEALSILDESGRRYLAEVNKT